MYKRQTQGKGRRNNPWVAPAGHNLNLSFSTRIQIEPSKLPLFSLWIGTSVAQLFDELGHPIALKWPNDLYSIHTDPRESRKLGGILIERFQNHWIIGLGINLLKTQLPAELSHQATSLQNEHPHLVTEPDLVTQIAEAIISKWEVFLNAPQFEDIILPATPAKFSRHHIYHEQIVSFHSGQEQPMGRIVGVSEKGGLLLNEFSGIQEYVDAHTIRLCQF